MGTLLLGLFLSGTIPAFRTVHFLDPGLAAYLQEGLE